MSATTSRGYPYPQLTDAVDQLVAFIQSLATAIDTDMTTQTVPKFCRLIAQATANLANNTAVAIPFASGSESDANGGYDNEGWHDDTTNNTRITPTIAGWYEVSGGVAFTARTDYTITQSYARKNGTGGLAPASKPGLPATQISSAIVLPVGPVYVKMNGTTDYLEMIGLQANGAAATGSTVVSAQFTSVLQARLLART